MHQLLDTVRRHKVNIDGNICTVMVTILVLEVLYCCRTSLNMIFIEIVLANVSVIIIMSIKAESPNGARAPWSSGLQKNLNPQIFVSKNSEKNHSGGEYYDPSM